MGVGIPIYKSVCLFWLSYPLGHVTNNNSPIYIRYEKDSTCSIRIGSRVWLYELVDRVGDIYIYTAIPLLLIICLYIYICPTFIRIHIYDLHICIYRMLI